MLTTVKMQGKNKQRTVKDSKSTSTIEAPVIEQTKITNYTAYFADYITRIMAITKEQLEALIENNAIKEISGDTTLKSLRDKDRGEEYDAEAIKKVGPIIEISEYRRFFREEVTGHPIKRSSFFDIESERTTPIDPADVYEILKARNLWTSKNEVFPVYNLTFLPDTRTIEEIIALDNIIAEAETTGEDVSEAKKSRGELDTIVEKLACLLDGMQGMSVNPVSAENNEWYLEQVFDVEDKKCPPHAENSIQLHSVHEAFFSNYMMVELKAALDRIRKTDSKTYEEIKTLTEYYNGDLAGDYLLREKTGLNLDNLIDETRRYTDKEFVVPFKKPPGHSFDIKNEEDATRKLLDTSFEDIKKEISIRAYSGWDVAKIKNVLIDESVDNESLYKLVKTGSMLEKFLNECGDDLQASDEECILIDEVHSILGISDDEEQLKRYISEGLDIREIDTLSVFLNSEDYGITIKKDFDKIENDLKGQTRIKFDKGKFDREFLYWFIDKYTEHSAKDFRDVRVSKSKILEFFNNSLSMSDAVLKALNINHLPSNYANSSLKDILKQEAEKYGSKPPEIIEPMKVGDEKRYSAGDIKIIKDILTSNGTDRISINDIRLGLLFDYYDESSEELPGKEYISFEDACEELKLNRKGLDSLINRYSKEFETVDSSVIRVLNELKIKKGKRKPVKKFREEKYPDAELTHITKQTYDKFLSTTYELNKIGRFLTGIECKWAEVTEFYDYAKSSEYKPVKIKKEKRYHATDISNMQSLKKSEKVKAGIGLKRACENFDTILDEVSYTISEATDKLEITESDIGNLIENGILEEHKFTVVEFAAKYGVNPLISKKYVTEFVKNNTGGIEDKFAERFRKEDVDNLNNKNPKEGEAEKGLYSRKQLQKELAGKSKSSKAFFDFIINKGVAARIIEVNDGEGYYIRNKAGIESSVKHMLLSRFYEFLRENYDVAEGGEVQFLKDVKVNLNDQNTNNNNKSSGTDWGKAIASIDKAVEEYANDSTPVKSIASEQFAMNNSFASGLVKAIIEHSSEMSLRALRGISSVINYDSEWFSDVLTYADSNEKIDARIPLAKLLSEKYGLKKEVLEDAGINISKVAALHQVTVPALYNHLRTFQDSIITAEKLRTTFDNKEYMSTINWEKEIMNSVHAITMKDIDTEEEFSGYNQDSNYDEIGSLIKYSHLDFTIIYKDMGDEDKIEYLQKKGIPAVKIGNEIYTHRNIALKSLSESYITAKEEDTIITLRGLSLVLNIPENQISSYVKTVLKWPDTDKDYDLTRIEYERVLSKIISDNQVTYKIRPEIGNPSPIQLAMIVHGDISDMGRH